MDDGRLWLPTGRTLFHRAIIHGGSATASWAVSRDHRAYTASLAERLNCTALPTVGGDAGQSVHSAAAASRLIVHCLRQVGAAELVRAAADVTSPPVKYLSAYGPTLAADNEMLPAASVDNLMDHACSREEYVVYRRVSRRNYTRFQMLQGLVKVMSICI